MYVYRVHFSFAKFKTQLESEISILVYPDPNGWTFLEIEISDSIRNHLNIHLLFLTLKNKLLASNPIFNLEKTLSIMSKSLLNRFHFVLEWKKHSHLEYEVKLDFKLKWIWKIYILFQMVDLSLIVGFCVLTFSFSWVLLMLMQTRNEVKVMS